MRLSCNGCRVLRKGCADACTIRPCLQWIKDPAAQSNATVFLAKFYGRAGLINLIDAGRDDAFRPAIFRSLLYEACGRVVNPVYGSVGLLWSGNWALCQAAVEAVLRGEPIVQISDEAAAAAASPAHLIHKAGFDIRHVAKHDAAGDGQKKVANKQAPGADDDSEKKKAGRISLKRTSASSTSGTRSKKPKVPSPPEDDHRRQADEERAPSHASSTSHHHDDHQREESVDDTDAEASGSHVSQAEQQHSRADQLLDDEEEPEQQQQQLGLDLTLGFATLPAAAPCVPPPAADAGCGQTGCWKEPGGLAFRFL